MTKKGILFLALGAILSSMLIFCLFIGLIFRRPYRKIVLSCNAPEYLVYAVMKAESNFDEGATSSVGAVGLMQILPSTAQFICNYYQLPYQPDRLYEGEYNVLLGCKYLQYLLNKFPSWQTAVAAYNAGEGTVIKWLNNQQYSNDGITLSLIPYPETRHYLKKVEKFLKIYQFFFD